MLLDVSNLTIQYSKNIMSLKQPQKAIEVLKNITKKHNIYTPEVDLLLGDPSKAHKFLGWQAQTSLEKLMQMMVDADMKRVENELKVK